MGINIFSSLFKKSKPQPDTNYLALTLTPNKTIAAVWVLAEENVQILGIAQKSFTNVDTLIHESAVAIDTASKQAKSDVSDTVFGLSSYYFEGKNLSSESTAILKNMAEELELKAQAYVSLASSINHYLKVKESVTPNALLIGSFGDNTEVHLARNNQVLKTKVSKSQPSTIEKIAQLAGQIKTEEGHDLPSRIVVYGAVEESHIGKELTKKEDWKDLFVSTPKIDFIEDEQVAEAIAYSQAADVLGHDPMLIPAGEPKVENDKQEETEEPETPKPEQSVSKDMGFIEGEDILEVQKEHPEKSEEPKSDLENVQPPQEFAVEGGSQEIIDQEPQNPPNEPRPKKPNIIEKLTTLSWFQSFLDIFKGSKSPRKIAIGLVAIVVLLIIGAFIASKTLANVQVIILASTESQQDSFNVNAQRGGTLDVSHQTIPAEELTGSADGSQKAVTTGTKKTGDKAKGEVNILNWTTDAKTFSSGTVLITSNGVKFSLDSDVDVASRSASLPGQSQVNVTAQDIGTDGNIAANTDLTFQQYDQLLYSAKNDNALTGGDEKQVTVVAQDDIDKLTKSLLDSLTQKAKSNLQNSASGKKINDDAITITVTKKAFDNNLGDEASILNLDMSVQAKAIAYNEDDLKNVIAQRINENSQNNLEARPENVQITNIKAKTAGDKLNLSGDYNVDLVPKFNDDDLRSKIAGKSTKEARSTIKQIPQVSDVQFQFSPQIFSYFSLPTTKSRISFKIESTK